MLFSKCLNLLCKKHGGAQCILSAYFYLVYPAAINMYWVGSKGLYAPA